MDWKIRPAKKMAGEIIVPPDKSISHRAIMFGAISNGSMTVRNFLPGEDCISTLQAFRALGIEIDIEDERVVVVHGKGLKGLKAPKGPIYLGNSGTSMRIISGILAGQSFDCILTGDESLSRRPMKRIMDPLNRMGASVSASDGSEHAPITIKGKFPLNAIRYDLPIASAQVKSCIIAAGLYADGTTCVTEPTKSRDHTERMLKYFSADFLDEGSMCKVRGFKELNPRDIDVPGDISSAAFFLVAASIVEGNGLILRNVGINPTRTGIIDVLKRMGANIDLIERQDDFEPKCDIRVKYAQLKSTVVNEEEIPLLIDEIPVLCVAAAMAEGQTYINGIGELKVKETDRVKSMIANLTKAGVDISEIDGALRIVGGANKKLKADVFESFSDHRTAMSMAIATLVSDGESLIRDVACVATSYPDFLRDLTIVSQ